MIIDIHAHIVDRTYVEALRDLLRLTPERTGDGKTLYRHNGFTVMWSRDDMFDLDHRLREMDRKGIDVRVLTLSTPSVYLWPEADEAKVARRSNDALAALCRRAPDRLVGFATLPMKSVDAALAELDRATGELGMKGVAIGSNIDGIALNDGRYEPLWARIDALRLPVYEHPMFPKETAGLEQFELPLRVGLAFETTLVATRLIYGGVFERYPNFPYVMAHTGGALLMLLARLDNGYKLFPDCREFITRPPSTFAKQLYYDTAAFDPEVLMLAHRVVGAGHVLFGSDDPFIDSDTTHVTRLAIPDADKAAILGGNAAKMLELKA